MDAGRDRVTVTGGALATGIGAAAPGIGGNGYERLAVRCASNARSKLASTVAGVAAATAGREGATATGAGPVGTAAAPATAGPPEPSGRAGPARLAAPVAGRFFFRTARSESGVSRRAGTDSPARSFARSNSCGLTRRTRTGAPSATPNCACAPCDRPMIRCDVMGPRRSTRARIVRPVSSAVSST